MSVRRTLRRLALAVALCGTQLAAEARADVAAPCAAGARCEIERVPDLPPLLALWPLLALPPVAVALFAANQILARRQALRRPSRSGGRAHGSTHRRARDQDAE